jgi:urea transporter
MFLGSIATGLFIVLGLCVRNKIKAIYAIYGSLIGMWIGLLLLISQDDINAGLFGFNAVLCAVALGEMKKNAFFITTLTCIVSTLLYFAATKSDFIILTAPFVFTTWIVLAFEGRLLKSS